MLSALSPALVSSKIYRNGVPQYLFDESSEMIGTPPITVAKEAKNYPVVYEHRRATAAVWPL